MTVKKTIKPSDKFIRQQFIISTVFFGVGIVGLFIGAAHLIGFGILFMVLAFMHKDRDIIKIYDQNIEIKIAPLAATKFIKFSDLTKTERISEKKIFVHYMNGNDPKKLRMPVQMIDAKELSEFLEMLDSKINSAA